MVTPTGDGIAVRPADLAAHAGHLDSVAAGVTTAQQAGTAVRLDAGAYGQLCAVVPVLLGVLQDRLLDGIGTAAESLHDTGQRLRTIASHYQAADAGTAAGLDQVRDRL
jgi:Excreted virulence factor EspC, type VII ESX diderm